MASTSLLESPSPVRAAAGPAAGARPAAAFWVGLHRQLSRDREDPAAWGALEARVRVWARTQLGRRGSQAVDDTVADTCAAVAISLAQARGGETFQGFVYGHFLNARRRALLELTRQHATLDGIDPPAPDAHAPDPAALAALRGGLAALPARERRAVELRYLEGAPAVAIAAALGVSEGNARQILFRALAHLRRSVAAALAPTPRA